MVRFLVYVSILLSTIGCASNSIRNAQEPRIAPEMFSEEYASKFATEVCGRPEDRKGWTEARMSECQNRLEQAFFKRLDITYNYANPAEVVNKCDAYPIECKDPNNFERWAIESHQANKNRHEEHLSAQQSAARAEHWRRAGEAMQRAGQQLMNRSNSNETNCTTSPNVMGGHNIHCR